MLQQRQFTAGYQVPSSPAPSVGDRVSYKRWMGSTYVLRGRVQQVSTFTPRRYPGVTVYEYVITPEDGRSNLTTHVVDEGDIVDVLPVCPACGDHGYLSIVGDLDTPCPICNPIEMEVTF
jgi:hypothetical protein